MKKDKVKKVKVEKDPASLLLEVAASMCHFSTKAVNTNANGGGIRLSHDTKINLPYLSVSTIGASNVKTDYTLGAGDSPPAKLIDKGDCSQAALDMIKAYSEFKLNSLSDGNLRLRQVILSKEDGSYFAATPLNSPGFSELVSEKINNIYKSEKDAIKNLSANKSVSKSEISEEKEKTLYYCRAKMSFGGGNTQNIGMRIKSMQKPLYFKQPTESMSIKEAYSYFYKGIQITINQKHLRALSVLSSKKYNLSYRKEESKIIKLIISDLFSYAKYANQSIRESLDISEESSSICESKDIVVQCLIDPNLRNLNKGWEAKLSSILRNRLINALFKKTDAIGDQKTTLGWTSSETDGLLRILEEEIRCQAAI